ncbi:MAG TPA: 30S ribosome-binding factor RbfA [Actinocatenispora sp.]
MTDPARVRRYAERIKELVAYALRKQVKDPRLGMVTITDSRITNDLREATLYYTVLGDPAEQAATTAALASANGLLRSIVGKRLGLRHAPTLTFVTDEVPEHANHIEELLAAARAADADVQRQAAEADYAGESQPYKVDEDDEEEDAEEADLTEPRRTGGPA